MARAVLVMAATAKGEARQNIRASNKRQIGPRVTLLGPIADHHTSGGESGSWGYGKHRFCPTVPYRFWLQSALRTGQNSAIGARGSC